MIPLVCVRERFEVEFWYESERTRVYLGSATSSVVYPNRLYNRNATSTKTTKQIFLGDLLVATIESSTSSATTTYYVHTDHLGGTSVITNASGTISQVTDYYPYGGERINTQTNGFKEQRKYAGTEFDPDSLYNFMEARYYDSGRGQFISQDPTFLSLGDPSRLQALTGRTQESFLADPQQLNSYNYARGNPVNYKDPDGKAAFLLVPMALGGLAGAGFQYHADVTRNLEAGRTGKDAYLRNLSPGSTYTTAVGKAAGMTLAGEVGGPLVAGGIAGSINILGDISQGKKVDIFSAVEEGAVTAFSGGVVRSLSKVPGPKPTKLGATFFTGAHAQQALRNELVGSALQIALTRPGSFSPIGFTSYQSMNSSLGQLRSALQSLAKALSSKKKE